MVHAQVLLLLVLAGVILSIPTPGQFVPGSYFFVFHENKSASAEGRRTEFENAKGDVRKLLNNGGSIQNEFQFNDARGFLVPGSVTPAQLQALTREMGDRGTFEPNRKFELRLPGKVEVLSAKPANGASSGPSAAAACTGKTCCGRTVSLNLNSNLDWLDGTRNSKYCSPGDDTTKMDVFMLDTGVDGSHPEFAGRVTSSEDCYSASALPWTPNVDVEGHGTHTAGTVGSTSYGATPNVNIHAVKVLSDQGSGSDSTVICGFEKVKTWLNANSTRKAIVSMSLGYSGISNTVNTYVTSMVNTYGSRLVIVVAAGNDNVKACSETFACIDAVVAVGSTGTTKTESSWSNYGSCVDVMAPGENILSTYPSNQTAYMSGTSMATPLVSGVLAQYWLQNPTLTGNAIRASISSASSALFTAGVSLKTVSRKASGSPNKLIQYKCPFGGSC